MMMNKESLRDDILRVLPTSELSAVSKEYIAEILEIWHCTVQAELRLMRASWLPILLNTRWVFLDYSVGAIERQNNRIENMKNWYYNWMSRIQDYFNTIIEDEKKKMESLRY